MSRYFKGQTIPGPIALLSLAQALDCAPKDIDPVAVEVQAMMPRVGPTEAQPMAFHQDPEHPDRVFVHVNQSLPFDVAARIMVLLKEHRDAEAAGKA